MDQSVRCAPPADLHQSAMLELGRERTLRVQGKSI